MMTKNVAAIRKAGRATGLISPSIFIYRGGHFRTGSHSHVGPPLRVGKIVLLRKPGTWFDLLAELRAIDDDLALILIKGQLERVELSWLRRPSTI